MSEFLGPEDENSQYQERSPLLKKLLSEKAYSDPQAWITELIEDSNVVVQEICEDFGDEFIEVSIYPQSQLASYQDIFEIEDGEEPSYMPLNITTILNIIGYQLGHPDFCVETAMDVVNRLNEMGLFKFTDGKDQMRPILGYVAGAMVNGAYFRYLNTGDLPDIPTPPDAPQGNNDVPDVFKKFIEGNPKFRNLPNQ